MAHKESRRRDQATATRRSAGGGSVDAAIPHRTRLTLIPPAFVPKKWADLSTGPSGHTKESPRVKSERDAVVVVTRVGDVIRMVGLGGCLG